MGFCVKYITIVCENSFFDKEMLLMSYKDGFAAINLEMPERVPRTEYSADQHWDLVKAATGIEVNSASEWAAQEKASAAFRKTWNYDFVWQTCLFANIAFGDKRTKMGHAEYASGGTEYDNEITLLYDDPDEALKFDPFELYGKINIADTAAWFSENYKNQVSRTPEAVNMTGIYVTCMSGLIDLFGWDILLMMAGIDPKGFGELTNRYTTWMLQYFEALAKSDAPVVMVHDDICWTDGAFLAPDWYREFIFPNYKRLFAPLIESGKKIMYTSDGNFTEFVDDVAGCGVNGFVMEPTTDMKYIAEKYGKTHSFIGNADTRILLSGTKDDIEREVKRCMDIGKKCPGFFMAVGNHIPSNTPVDNALYYNEIYEKLSRR